MLLSRLARFLGNPEGRVHKRIVCKRRGRREVSNIVTSYLWGARFSVIAAGRSIGYLMESKQRHTKRRISL